MPFWSDKHDTNSQRNKYIDNRIELTVITHAWGMSIALHVNVRELTSVGAMTSDIL